MSKNPQPRLSNVFIDHGLADRIRAARALARMSTDEMARILGVSVATLNRIETGKRPPTQAEIAEVAEATGVPRDWIYVGFGQAGPEAEDDPLPEDLNDDDAAMLNHLQQAARRAFPGRDQEAIAVVDHMVAAFQTAISIGMRIELRTEFDDFRLDVSTGAIERAGELMDDEAREVLEQELEGEAQRHEQLPAADARATPGRRRRAQG